MAEERIEQLKKEQEKQLHAKSRVEKENKSEIISLPSSLGLYHTICKIQWDFESSNVKGLHIDPVQGDVTPFDFDPSHMSKVAVTNAIWDLLPV